MSLTFDTTTAVRLFSRLTGGKTNYHPSILPSDPPCWLFRVPRTRSQADHDRAREALDVARACPLVASATLVAAGLTLLVRFHS